MEGAEISKRDPRQKLTKTSQDIACFIETGNFRLT
jgi:hypothetical protein